MDAQHIKLFSGALVIASGLAVLFPYAQRELAVYQLRASFPGLVSSPARGPRPWFVSVEHVDTDESFAKTIVSVTNKSETETMSSAFIECADFDYRNKPFAMGNGIVLNIPAGQARPGEILIDLPKGGPHYGIIKCRGTSVWR